jgi:hypothetical protein
VVPKEVRKAAKIRTRTDKGGPEKGPLRRPIPPSASKIRSEVKASGLSFLRDYL